MAQRTFTLHGVYNDPSGSPIGNAPCSFRFLLSGAGAIDGNGALVSSGSKTFNTASDGSFSVTVDFPGDFQAAYAASVVRLTLSGNNIDSPASFGYASSIAFTDWITPPPVVNNQVTMRVVYTLDDGSPIQGAVGSVALSDIAVVTATGQLRSSSSPSPASSDSGGTMFFKLDPNSLLTPSNLGYVLSILGEPTPWSFTVPAVVDVYRGSWNVGTTYSGASGPSNGDVVVYTDGNLYRYIFATPSAGALPTDATHWYLFAANELPTDLITANTATIVPSGGATLNPGAIAHSPDVPPLTGEPEQTPTNISDDLENLVYRIATRPDATTTTTGVVEIDVVPGAGHPIVLTVPRLGAASGVADLDAAAHVPLTRLIGITAAQIAASAGITGSQLSGAAAIAAAQIASVNPSALTGSGTVPVAKLPVMVASGASHAAGVAPDPGATAGITRFLREDATYAAPTGNIPAGAMPYYTTPWGRQTLGSFLYFV